MSARNSTAVRRLITAFLALHFAGCQAPPDRKHATKQSGAEPLFEEVAARAGITFSHTNGAAGRFYFPESFSGGCALLDYDNDSFLDILLVQSGPSDPPSEVNERPASHLYHNRGDGTFDNVTAGSGFDRNLGYGFGAASGDFDNDGFIDVFITAVGGNHLFRNLGGSGKFADVTDSMGLGKLHSTGFATSAAFGDIDNDSRLDLYVCYYAPWTHEKELNCPNETGARGYCRPEMYPPDTHRLYRNLGARFVDVSDTAGIAGKKGRGLAVAFVDFNEDGRQDIFVANDLEPNMLWKNLGSGRFTDAALEANCAYSEGGALMAAMGIAIADYDQSGRESLFVTNFSGMQKTLFRNIGGFFDDVSVSSGVAPPQTKFLSFGAEFLDYDADTWPDLLVANGHIQPNPESILAAVTYRQRKQLFHNDGGGSFHEIADPGLLGGLGEPAIARGLAVGDIDNDGRVDALFVNQNGPPQLFRNRDKSAGHWISFKTVGTASNRDGRHARFKLWAGGKRLTSFVRAGGSYCSHSDPRVYFGLGSATWVDRVTICWPSGVEEQVTGLPADAFYTATEGRGVKRSGRIRP